MNSPIDNGQLPCRHLDNAPPLAKASSLSVEPVDFYIASLRTHLAVPVLIAFRMTDEFCRNKGCV
jgi:hypothetical protein